MEKRIKIIIITFLILVTALHAGCTDSGSAEFELSDLVVGSSEVEVGEEVEVSVDVENVGEREGSYVVELVVGEDVLSKNVSLGGGESTTVSFVVSRDEADVYDVKVGNLSSSLEFTSEPESAEFVISDLETSSSEIQPGEDIEVTVNVKNIGEKTGTKELELMINNEIEETKTLELSGDENNQVTFTVFREKKGTYTISIDELSGTFEV